MDIPLPLRVVFMIGAALSAMPSAAFAADTTPIGANAGDRSVLPAPEKPAAPAVPAAPVTLPAPATAAQANADAAGGFKDVPTTHWAYPALQQLQSDGIVVGYPDGYFRGKRSITRYEIAAITARAIKHVQDMLASAQTAPKVSPDDIATLRKLIDDNTTQLQAVQKNVAALQTQTDLNTATLKRQQFHLYYFLRAPGTYTDRVNAYDRATGLALAPSKLVVGPNVGIEGPQILNSGLTAHGTGYQTLRMIYSGDVDPKVSYAIRLEDRYYLDNTNANNGAFSIAAGKTAGNSIGDSTSGITPGTGSFPNNGELRINYATVKYTDPSGFYGRVGRYVEGSGDIGLAFSDYFNGGEVGYNKGHVQGFVGYSFNKASNSNAGVYTGLSSQSLLARVGTPIGTKAEVGVNYITDKGNYGGGPTLANPATGLLQEYATPLTVGSVDVGYAFGPYLGLKAEYLHRFGNSPLGGSWSGPNAFWGQGTAGKSAGKIGNNYLDFGYIISGANSTSVHTEIEGTPDYQQFFINNPNGYKIAYVGLHHYFGTNAQIGVIVQGWGLNGSTLPIDYVGGTAAAPVLTPGIVTRDQGQAIFLETRLNF